MKLLLESTDKVVALQIGGVDVPARVWQGETPDGVQIHAFVTRVAVPNSASEEVMARFAADIQAVAPMRQDVRALDFRYFVD